MAEVGAEVAEAVVAVEWAAMVVAE